MVAKTFLENQDDNSRQGSSNIESREKTVTESLQENDVYEGVEKKLILKYSGARNVSIRKAIKEKVWRNVVEAVDAEVLSVMRSDKVDAYLLSESSLFVFKDKILLKTCGTTRIFNSVKVIVAHVSEEIPGIKLTRVIYSRPTYRFPDHQLKGYGQGFEKEVALLRAVTMKATARSWDSTVRTTGEGITFHSSILLPSEKKEKTILFERCDKSKENNQENICMDLAMFNLDQSKLKHFFGHQVNVLENSCVRGFLPLDSPRLQIDDYSFQPCGYSLNALDGGYYWCIHITPELEYSYLSFETNHPSALDICQKLKDFYSPEKAIVLWIDERCPDFKTTGNF